ncbi:MAG: response regulator transcription factor [Ardenticatenaceae bacterium]|nr:response regulator transcription factor [Anaerolineales bacterium]MCB8921578.1 response regulator transcription factor [Ardenticatenaceae bacterium]MCB9003885.1 response regulator transcription factor [Ardenticatenaceae bacterium]
MTQIRILLADDHEVVRRGLSLVLRQEPDFVIVGEAQNGAEAVQLAEELLPDLVLLDWKMPRLNGLQAAQQVKEFAPQIRTLLLSGAPVETAVLDALENGVDGFVHKDISPRNLAHAIRMVAGGKRYLGQEITQALIARSLQPDPAPAASQTHTPLSERELEVLTLMATPATYREIGEQLFISEETVRTYAKRIFTKLNQPNRTQAVIAALRLGVISIQ